jgi:uncharacterized protein involved in response to NO
LRGRSASDDSSAGQSRIGTFEWPVLARGFRPFFLLAALHAALFVPLWASMATGKLTTPGWSSPSLWHAHEMVYGFAGAAAVGFLLTAVPVWTGAAAVNGSRLAALAMLWIAARAVLAVPFALPALVTASVDVALPCALLAVLARPLLQQEQRRNRVFIPVLVLLALSAAGLHVAAIVGWPAIGTRSARVSLDGMSLLVVIVGGRIVPSFTQNGLVRMGGTRKVWALPALDRASLAAVWAVVAVDALALEGPIAASARILAATLLGARMLGWQSLHTLHDPLLWSLHLGFAWLPLGLALLGLSDLGVAIPAAAGLHALGVGGLGSMVLAVMTRVALGHTGRPIVAPRGISLAYLAVSASAALRIASAWPVLSRSLLLLASAALFSAAYACFLWIYAPILVSPRIDGKEG